MHTPSPMLGWFMSESTPRGTEDTRSGEAPGGDPPTVEAPVELEHPATKAPENFGTEFVAAAGSPPVEGPSSNPEDETPSEEVAACRDPQ